MRAARRAVLAAIAAAGVGGCGMQAVRVDGARLANTPAPKVALACGYRLRSLVDARPAGAGSGTVGRNAFVLDAPVEIVRNQLAAVGLREDGTGEDVDVRLMQFYLSSNTVTLVPVVVYEATVRGRPPVVLRGQPASMNDWNSQNELTAAYASALQVATARLVSELNASCPAR